MTISKKIRQGLRQFELSQMGALLAVSLLCACVTAAVGQSPQPAVKPPVRGLPLALPEGNLPDGFVGLPFGSSVTAVGGSGLYSVLVSGELPPGMALARGGGVIALVGVPTRDGTYEIHVAVTDIDLGTSKSHDYIVQIHPQLAQPQAAAATVTVSDAESFKFTDTDSVFFPVKINDVETFHFLDNEAVFMPLLVSDPETFHFTDTVTVTTKLGITPTTTPAGTVNAAYSQTFSVVGNTGAITFSLTGVPAAGMSLVCGSSSCTLSGTPVQGGTFPFSITAKDSINTTTVSYSLVIAGATQTINIGTLPMPTFGGAPFSVSATATSGLPVTIQYVSGPATGSGSGPYTATDAGVVNFTATQAGNTSYTAATPVNFSVTVAAATQTINVGTLPTPTYGGAPFSVSATATSGLPVTITRTSGPATGTGSGPYTTTGAGTVNFTATQTGSTSYLAATPVSFSVTVAKQASVTAVSASPTSITPIQTTTFTALVSGATTGSPTGTITFFDNGVPIGSPVPVAGGQAQLSTLLLSGAQAISATYSGDGNFLGSSSASSTTVSVAPLDFTMSALSPVTLNVVPGSSAVVSFNVTPLYLIYPAPVTFSVSGLPSSATYTITPTSIAANGGPQTVTVTIQTKAAVATNALPSRRAPLALALFLPLLAWGTLRRRRRWFGGVMLLLGVLASGAVVGCGTNTGNGYFGQAQQTYPVVITATSGTMQHRINVSLEVQ